MLASAQARYKQQRQIISDGRSGPGVDDVQAVLIAEVVIYAQCSCIDNASAGQNRVISGNAPPSVNGRTNTDLRKVGIDQSLDVGFSKREGIVMNCWPRPPTVSLAISSGVSSRLQEHRASLQCSSLSLSQATKKNRQSKKSDAATCST